MRVIFLGTPTPAVPALQSIVDAGHDVRLVVTQPDRPVGRSRRLQAPPVKQAAASLGIETIQPRRVKNKAFVTELLARDPEVLVVVAYGRILPMPVLECARFGAVNVHFSLLPEYRGAAPVQWALANGETTTGVTTMKLNERMDEGDVLLRRSIEVELGEHTPELQARLAGIGADLIVETLAGLDRGDLDPEPQDHSLATLAPLLDRRDGEVDFELTARQIEGRVRGFDPWPGVWVGTDKGRLRIIEAQAAADPARELPPGTLLDGGDGSLLLSCGGGTLLKILRIQPAGRRVMDVRDAINGRQIRPGQRLSPLGQARS